MVFACFLGAVLAAKGPIITPYRSTEKLLARTIRAEKAEIDRNEPVDLTIDADATFDNPFDSRDISVRVQIEQPGGGEISVPGYFYVPCERKLVDEKEVVTKVGKPVWRAKASFEKAGTYRLSAFVKDRSGTSLTDTISIKVREELKPGIVRVSEKDHRYFETSDGQSFFPIGANVCWAGPRGTFDYDTWLPKYAAQGANFFRVWLAPGFFTFGLEQKGAAKDGQGLGTLSVENLWKLDHVVALARKNGLRIKFCIESFNVLRDLDGYNAWENGPHSIANGGILHTPKEFWSNSEMDTIFLNKMRHLVARYAADPTVFAWEFWNEADLTRDFPVQEAKEWHQRMARELRKMDLYRHPITTSFADSMGVKDIDMLSEIDFIQTHNYSAPDVISQVAVQQSRKGSWGKPHYVGEIGADWAGPRAEEDPEGLQIHDPLWISTAMSSSGAAMPWWWDNLIEPKNCYPLFGALSRFVSGIDFPKEEFRQSQPVINWQSKPNPLPRKDLLFSGGPSEWAESPYNKPRTVRISDDGVTGQLPISGLLHGTVNHPTWHNPVTFIVNFPKPTPIDVTVAGVSGWGGGRLSIEINGSAYLTRDFPQIDPNNHDTMTKYDGTYSVTIPAGKQVVTVKNLGNDWFNFSVRFREALVRSTPPLIGWATVGNTTALAWIRVEDRTWRQLIVMKEKVPAAPPSIVSLNGLASGNWKVELWDTWTGAVTSTQTVKVGINGLLKLNLPAVEKDVAIKATLTP